MISFPDTILHLELPVWHDHNGRYRDLPFPSSLKRLVFTGEINKNDFDLTQWVHLPFCCENFELKLLNENGSWIRHSKPFKQLQPTSPIIISRSIKQLRIRRECGSNKWQLPPLELMNATSLDALTTDSLDQILWTKSSSSVLTALKPKVSGHQFLTSVFPTHLKFLDLSCVDSWNVHVTLSDYQGLHTLFPNLTRLVAPVGYKVELINKADPVQPMIPAFKEVMTEIFNTYSTTMSDDPLVTAEPRKTMSKNDMRRYILACGAGELSTTDERLTNIFAQYARPQGWSNYDQLTVDGFCEFYRDACTDRVENVWNDLRVHGYRHRLIRDEFFTHLVAFSLALPHVTVIGRLSRLDDHFRPPPPGSTAVGQVVESDDRCEWYEYVNGICVSQTVMTSAESSRRQQMDEAIFDCKPSESEE